MAIAFGSSVGSALFFGSAPISAAYFGDQLIFSSAPAVDFSAYHASDGTVPTVIVDTGANSGAPMLAINDGAGLRVASMPEIYSDFNGGSLASALTLANLAGTYSVVVGYTPTATGIGNQSILNIGEAADYIVLWIRNNGRLRIRRTVGGSSTDYDRSGNLGNSLGTRRLIGITSGAAAFDVASEADPVETFAVGAPPPTAATFGVALPDRGGGESFTGGNDLLVVYPELSASVLTATVNQASFANT